MSRLPCIAGGLTGKNISFRYITGYPYQFLGRDKIGSIPV